uniref:FBA_2 domain-containing protein n=1 Tax=Caenorhabditis tropicalis TaxID=1561998 RepID=A0A1I7V1C2_9PELO
MMIDWLNGLKNEIKNVWIHSATAPLFELFLSRLRKRIRSLGVLNITFEQGEIAHKCFNFEISHNFVSNGSKWIYLDLLFSMDTERIFASETNFSAKDLNVFLRSWQEGKTNQKLKQVKSTTYYARDMKKVLKDCGAELMDPRTTKLKFRELDFEGCYEDIWIHGGIHIKGNDGRLAVIKNKDYGYIGEHGVVPKEQIIDYLKALEIWNSDDKWYGSYFEIYIFL